MGAQKYVMEGHKQLQRRANNNLHRDKGIEEDTRAKLYKSKINYSLVQQSRPLLHQS